MSSRRAGPSPRVARNRRIAVALVVVAALAATAVVLAGPSGEGPPRSPGTDLGHHTDAAVLGQTVEAGLGAPGRDGGAPSSATTCADEARATYGRGLGPLVYSATLRWHGTRAVALAYRVDGAPPAGLDHRVLVLATEGCRLLVAQAL